MTSTVPQLGARVLRKLGLNIIPDSAITSDTKTYTQHDLATRALREAGIVVPENLRPAALAPVGLPELAARALRSIGINPISAADAGPLDTSTIAVSEIAARALRSIGVNPFGPITDPTIGNAPTSSLVEMATLVLTKLGIYDPDEVPSPADLARAVVGVQQAEDTVFRAGIYVWANDAAPNWAVAPIVQMAMSEVGSSFGKPQVLDLWVAGMQQIWLLSLSGPDGQARAEAAVSGVHNRLAALGFTSWDVNTIPSRATDSYTSMVAEMLIAQFSGEMGAFASGSQYTAANTSIATAATARMQIIGNAQNAAASALESMRTMALSGAYGQMIAESKVSAVHESLSVQGVVSWQISAVPAAYAETYAAMAATLLAPALGLRQDAPSRQVDQAIWEAGEARLHKGAQIAGAQALAESRIATAHGEWVAANLANWPLSAVPESVADAYVQMAVNNMAASFGSKFDPATAAQATARVRAVVMGGPAGQALAEQKIRVVHMDLDARGKTLFSLFDLPDYAEEIYVQMAAYLLAPECAVKCDPNWYRDGEAKLNRVIALQSNNRPVKSVYF